MNTYVVCAMISKKYGQKHPTSATESPMNSREDYVVQYDCHKCDCSEGWGVLAIVIAVATNRFASLQQRPDAHARLCVTKAVPPLLLQYDVLVVVVNLQA